MAQVLACAEKAFAAGKSSLVLDMRELDTVDAALLSTLTELRERFESAGCYVAAVMPISRPARSALRENGLERRLNRFATRAAALVSAALGGAHSARIARG